MEHTETLRHPFGTLTLDKGHRRFVRGERGMPAGAEMLADELVEFADVAAVHTLCSEIPDHRRGQAQYTHQAKNCKH